MAIRELVTLPDSRLRKRSDEIIAAEFDGELQSLIDDMFATMYHARGVGLAAPQIGINKRLSVIDVSSDKSQQLVLINPEIIAQSGQQTFEEGCLSVPGIYERVTRAAKVTLRALDRQGQSYELEADELLAECIQHEIDHLDGKLFIDLLSPLKRERARQKFAKTQRSVRKNA